MRVGKAIWTAAFASQLGEEWVRFGLVCVALQAIGQAGAGVVLVALSLPSIVGGPILGMSARAIGPFSHGRGVVAAGATLLVLAALSLRQPPPAILVAATVLAGFFMPSRELTLRVDLGQAIDPVQLPTANRILGAMVHGAVIAGPISAAVVVDRLGGAATMAVGAATWVTFGVLISRHARTPIETAQARSPRRTAGAPQRMPRVLGILTVSGMFYFAYGPMEAAIPAFAVGTSDQSLNLGLLWAAQGVAALLGLFLAPRLFRDSGAWILPAGALGWGLSFLPMLSGSEPSLLGVCLFAAGLAWGPYTAHEATLIQRVALPEQHGIAFGARKAVVVAAEAMGTLVGSLLLGSGISSHSVLLVSGAMCVGAGALGLGIVHVVFRRSVCR
jgi:hypothetical protein